MMEFIQKETFSILLFLIIYAFLLVVIGFIQEFKLRYRSKINFKNFLKLINSFQLKIKKVYVFLIFLFIISSTYYSLIIIRNPVYSIYIIVIELLNILLFLILLLHISSVKYNKDISVYSNYHRIIRKSFDNKEQLLEQIKNLENMHKSLIMECNELNTDFSKYFINYTGIDNLMGTLLPINEVIKSYQEQTSSFDYNITNNFNFALRNYLKTGEHNSLTIKEFEFIDTVSLKNILSSINNEQKQCIHNFSLNKLKDNHIISPEQLMNLIVKLVLLKISITDEFVMEIMNYINVQFNYKKKILSLLTNQKLISVNVLCHYIHLKDWSWVYDIPLSKLINQQDSLMVFTSIINSNASNCAFKILTSFDPKFNKNLKKALTQEKTENETRKMFVIFSKLQTSDDFVNRKSIKYENLAVILNHYFEDYYRQDNEAVKIREIVKHQTFEENAKYIETVYERVKAGYKDLFLKTVNTLFIYSNSSCSMNEYINYEKMLNQYSEYRKNLNINELNILDVLIKILILINEEDISKINTIYEMLEENVDKVYKGKLSKKDLQYEKRIYVGKTIIKNLTNNNNIKTLKRVLNRIENGRVVLDKVVNM